MRIYQSPSSLFLRAASIGFLVLQFSFGLAASEVLKFVAWKPIEDASGYQIQIRDSKGKVFIDKKIEKNYFSVQDIPTGDMMVRTAPLNAFQKPVTWSPWTELEVMLSAVPSIEFFKDRPTKEIAIDKEFTEIEIDGSQFLDVTEIELTLKDKKLPVVEKKYVNENRIDVKVDTRNAKGGDYDLTIINPFQKPQKVPKFLKVQQKVEEPKVVVKEEPPPPPPPKEEPIVEVPKGKPYHEYTYPEFMAFLETLKDKKECSTKVPEPAVAECFKTYITLNVKSKDNRDIFAFFRLINSNETDRYFGYEYFEKQCSPVFRPAKERMEYFVEKEKGNVDPLEVNQVYFSLQRLKECSK